jgi:hypothetical protein
VNNSETRAGSVAPSAASVCAALLSEEVMIEIRQGHGALCPSSVCFNHSRKARKGSCGWLGC